MKKKLLSLLLSASLILASCAPMNEQESQNVAMGTAGGALVGALLGQAIGRDTKGTLIGAAAGALIGAIVVSNIQKNTKKVSEAATTRANNNYQPGQGFVLKNGAGYVAPQKATHGDTVKVSSNYDVMGAPSQGATVREAVTLWYNGQLKGNICDDEVVRNDGTWNIELSFVVPNALQPGTYVIQRDIYYEGSIISQKFDFTVV